MHLPALVMNDADNVATAVRPLTRGETIAVAVGEKTVGIVLLCDIPFGHKLAIQDIESGVKIVKYGETIGQATAAIRQGDHVHVHNVAGLRGRVDKT